MSKCKVGFIGALMLVLTGTTAGAADLGGDYRGSLKDDDYYEVSENTRGWYLRGDIGGTFYDDFTMTDSNAAKFILEDIDDNFMFGGGIGYNRTGIQVGDNNIKSWARSSSNGILQRYNTAIATGIINGKCHI